MNIDYNHSQNLHSPEGPKAAMPILFAEKKPASLLDVGCGTGTWLKAAVDFGIADIFGVDGIEIPQDKLDVPVEKTRLQDLTKPWTLNRRFDAAMCFEVGEHLDCTFAAILVDALVNHSDTIFFSAACPGQTGQHHVNCQWPTYWQDLFNKRGFTCDDSIRWKIWDNEVIEPWYRQNMFIARRNVVSAGYESRIKDVLHPDMLLLVLPESESFESHVKQIENGRKEVLWYLKTPVPAFIKKLKRNLF